MNRIERKIRSNDEHDIQNSYLNFVVVIHKRAIIYGIRYRAIDSGMVTVCVA